MEKYLAALKAEGKSARTMNHHLTTAKSFFNWAVEGERLAANPLGEGRRSKIKRQRERNDRRRQRRAASVEELQALFTSPLAVKRGRHHIYIACYWTGLRRGEASKITWADVDLGTRRIYVPADVSKAATDDAISTSITTEAGGAAHAQRADRKMRPRTIPTDTDLTLPDVLNRPPIPRTILALTLT